MAVSNAAEPKLTECTVCHEPFSVPKLLPCGHRLCRDCLVTLMRSQPQAGCPLCRCVIVDPTEPGGRSVEEVADGFPTDLAMTAMVEAETLLSKQHVCCVCLNVAAVALCLQCGDMFCQHCTNVHKRQTVSRHHQVEDLISLTVEKLATQNPSTCPDHKDEVAKIYCPKHRSSVCLLCALSDHGDCPQKVKLQSRVDELAAELAQVNTMVSGAEAKSAIKLSLLDKLVKVLQKQCKAAQDQIKTTGDRLKAAIDARVTYTKQIASELVSDVIKKAEEVKKNIINNQCKMSTHRNLTELYTNFKDHKSFNDMVSLLKKRVLELDLDPKLPDEVCLSHSLKLTIDCQAVARIEKEISQLGEIVLSSAKDEFLNNWFPDLESKSYIIPTRHLKHIQANDINHGNVPIKAIKAQTDCKLSTVQKEITELDETHEKIHSLFAKFKDQEVMVMMTQANFSMYSSPAQAASASLSASRTGEVPLEDIKYQKSKHSDLVIVNKRRGVLVGVVQSVDTSDPNLAKKRLEESVTDLKRDAETIEEVVRMVPGADNVTVHTMLVLTNITRAQFEGQLQLQKLPGVPCLCKDEMDTYKGLKHWWQDCWSSEHQNFMASDVYRHLVAKFAIPTTRVEIYLTTQPRLQLKHEHDVVNAVGDVCGAEVFQAGLHQLSLFPTQAELLDFYLMDESKDDVKFLWGPPGTGKTILLVLRALQWVKRFSGRHIVILQTSKDGTAASCLVEYQLQQTLNAQQQRARHSGTDTQSAQCTFTHVDMSKLWGVEENRATHRYEVVLKVGWKEKLYTALGLQQRGQSDTAIHIVADAAQGDVVAAVYQWLKEVGVPTVRLWAAGVEAFVDKKNIPASLQHAVCHVTEPLRCPGPVVQEVMRAFQIKEGRVPGYDVGWQLTDGPAIVQLQHYPSGRDGHTGYPPWRCGQCAKNITATLKSLHVGEADEGHQGLSANDVFILGSYMDCDVPDDSDRSPAPLINGLQDNGYNVRTLSRTSARDRVMSVVKRDVTPPAVTVVNEDCVWGLERKIVVYCGSVGVGTDLFGRLRAFSRSTSLLIYIK